MATTILPIAEGSYAGVLRRLPRGRGHGGDGDRLGSRAEGGRRLEGRGSERCVCFFSLKYPSAWGFCPCGVVLFNGRFCPLQGSSPTRLQQRANVLVLTNRDMILKLHFVKFKSFCTVLDLEHIIYRISFSLIHGSCFY